LKSLAGLRQALKSARQATAGREVVASSEADATGCRLLTATSTEHQRSANSLQAAIVLFAARTLRQAIRDRRNTIVRALENIYRADSRQRVLI
jgi:hypothetical protein